MSHWLYKGKPIKEAPENEFGFVYLITNLKSGKKYIGRKYFGTTRRVKVKGKKRRKIIRKDSNWREYTGSSKSLNKDIEKLGKKNFKFEKLKSIQGHDSFLVDEKNFSKVIYEFFKD